MIPGCDPVSAVTAGRECKMKKSSSRTIYKRVVIILFILLVICAAAAIILIRTPGARYRHNVNLGRRYMHGRQYDEAVRVFTKAIEVDPDRSEAYRGRGDAYVKMDEMEQAYDDYKRVEELTGESGLAERKTGLSDPSETGSSGTETPQTVTPGSDAPASSGPQGDAAGKGPSAEPTQAPSPEVQPTPEEKGPTPSDYDAFLEAVRSDPYGHYFQDEYGTDLSEYDKPAIMYAMGDLDRDEVNEVFLSYTNSGSPYNVINTEVWKWNGSSFEVYSVDGGSYATKDFYSLGYIRTYPKNPKTLIDPFTVMGYNPATKSYDIEIFSVKGVGPDTMPSYGEYSPELDADGDGIIYYENNEIPLTREEYEALLEPYVPDWAHVDLSWQLLISF